MIESHCQCGAVRFRVSGELKEFCHCHCSVCRRLHGAAFASWGAVRRDELVFLSGGDALKTYPFSKHSDSLFCRHCGSRILVDYRPEPELRWIALGAVEDLGSAPEGYHQYVGSKARWHEISDHLPRFDEEPE